MTPQPITYPKITIPGRGEFQVKFGLAAARIVDRDLGLDGLAVLEKLQRALPKLDPSGAVDAEGNPKRVLGEVRLDFLLTLLSACIWAQAHMTPEQIAQAYDEADEPIYNSIGTIVGTLITAVSKTKWSAQTPRLGESATNPTQESKPALN